MARAAVLGGLLAAGLALAGCTAGRTAQDASTSAAGTVPASAAAVEPSAVAAAGSMTTTDEHSEVGELVPGFPAELLPLPDDATILVTSAVPVGDADVQEVSLNLRTSMTADALLEMYRVTLVGAGFTEVPPATTEPGLAAQSMFTRSGGDELVSIGVLDVDGARTVTVGGRVHTGS
ncbi:MAG: hypothetical protein JWP95_42 [Actinotalea sp.]|nr:hypothetical protein [Actinotalea sp.]